MKNLVLYDQKVRPLVVDTTNVNDSGNSVALYPRKQYTLIRSEQGAPLGSIRKMTILL